MKPILIFLFLPLMIMGQDNVPMNDDIKHNYISLIKQKINTQNKDINIEVNMISILEDSTKQRVVISALIPNLTEFDNYALVLINTAEDSLISFLTTSFVPCTLIQLTENHVVAKYFDIKAWNLITGELVDKRSGTGLINIKATQKSDKVILKYGHHLRAELIWQIKK